MTNTCQRQAQPSSNPSNSKHPPWCGWCGEDLAGEPIAGPQHIPHDFCKVSCLRSYMRDLRTYYDAARYLKIREERVALKAARMITRGRRP